MIGWADTGPVEPQDEAPTTRIPEYEIQGEGSSEHDLQVLWHHAGALEGSTDDAASVEAVLRHPTSRVFVAIADGRLIGSLIAGWDGWRGAMYRLVVDPAWRRRGIATELVRHAEEHLRDQGAVRVGALVMEGETDAEAFWSSVGYQPHEGDRRFVRMLGDRGATAPPSARR